MTLTKLLINAKLEEQKVVFWGFALNAQISIFKNPRLNAPCSYFVDNNAKKQNNGIGTDYGIPAIYGPEKLLEEDKNTYIMITLQTYRHIISITNQLLDMGFSNIYAHTEQYVYPYDDYELALMTPQKLKELENYTPQDDYSLVNRFEALDRFGVSKIRSLFHDEYSKALLDKIVEKYRVGNRLQSAFSDICEKSTHYFDEVLIDVMHDNEVFVNAGVFDNETTIDFIVYVKNKYKAIYGFEPDQICFAELKHRLRDIPKLNLINSGLSDSTGTAVFFGGGLSNSKMEDSPFETNMKVLTDSSYSIQTTTIDEFFADKEPPTFIKMDIEGAEYKALLGAEKIIKTYKPKLAISAYHAADDLAKLPYLIKEFVPEYKLYLRHYSNSYKETVLYAKI
ncbi:MAG: FkbM family methyltransferase [Turicibacter sp.]|nr:FkbM family methyltransferase [Turicibacter sp.]